MRFPTMWYVRLAKPEISSATVYNLLHCLGLYEANFETDLCVSCWHILLLQGSYVSVFELFNLYTEKQKYTMP